MGLGGTCSFCCIFCLDHDPLEEEWAAPVIAGVEIEFCKYKLLLLRVLPLLSVGDSSVSWTPQNKYQNMTHMKDNEESSVARVCGLVGERAARAPRSKIKNKTSIDRNRAASTVLDRGAD